jgi:glycosyltransferase involved in cell wall biosynthesis
MREVVVVSADRVGPELAGAGIRALELARVLGSTFTVTLAAPVGSSSVGIGPDPAIYDPGRPRTLRRLLSPEAIVVAPPLAPRLLIGSRVGPWIVDLYNPEPFEGLAHERRRLEQRARDIVRIDRIGFAARAGAAFICASERQRDMWLGFLAASRRLDSNRYARDLELRDLIDVVPFGVPDEAPVPHGERLRGTIVPPDAKLVVWNGGLWDWLDPETVVRAVGALRRRDPSWNLVFVGVGRPGHREPMRAAIRAIQLAEELGLGSDGALHVREWTPYLERAAPLLDADVGASAHRATAEARFAHRTRMLDLVWAGVPIVCTKGDEWSEIVGVEGLGEVVPPGDAPAFADAIERVAAAGRRHYAPALAAAAAKRGWVAAADPLARFVENVGDLPRRRRDAVRSALALRHAAAGAAARARAALDPTLRI